MRGKESRSYRSRVAYLTQRARPSTNYRSIYLLHVSFTCTTCGFLSCPGIGDGRNTGRRRERRTRTRLDHPRNAAGININTAATIPKNSRKTHAIPPRPPSNSTTHMLMPKNQGRFPADAGKKGKQCPGKEQVSRRRRGEDVAFPFLSPSLSFGP